MKSLKDFKCDRIISNLDIKKGDNYTIFGVITIKASPPIYIVADTFKQLEMLLSVINTLYKLGEQ